jgi:hypothetical protein
MGGLLTSATSTMQLGLVLATPETTTVPVPVDTKAKNAIVPPTHDAQLQPANARRTKLRLPLCQDSRQTVGRLAVAQTSGGGPEYSDG